MIVVHVLLDNLIMGSLSLMYTPAMLVGWMTLPLILHLLKSIKNKWVISAIVGLHGILYSLCFAFTQCLLLEVPFISYVIADIPFTIILIVNGFVTTFILLEPCVKVLRRLAKKEG